MDTVLGGGIPVGRSITRRRFLYSVALGASGALLAVRSTGAATRESGGTLIAGWAAESGAFVNDIDRGAVTRNLSHNMDDANSKIERTRMPIKPGNGMVHLRSHYSVQQTVQRVEAVLPGHGLTVFGRVDHSGEAERVGLKMPPTQLLLFGSPKAGTPLMLASPTLAIDLPLKALVWEDADGSVWLSYDSPEYLKQRHSVPDALIQNITGAGVLLQQAAA